MVTPHIHSTLIDWNKLTHRLLTSTFRSGKVIQPQPRTAALQTTNLQKEGIKPSGKPAWGNVKPPSVPPIMTSQDFPTAAEVAQASATRKSKTDDQKSTPESASTVKHRLEEEADTFRGVHLDPNAHHWDEMEEDNDDFLGGVIEFGDGRQYKVEATEPSSDQNQPVNKEDRFVDDFDRSWPKSKPSPTSSTRDFTVTSPALSSRGTSQQSAQDHGHPQLFNERSNRLEPYSNHGPRTGQQPTFQNRRGSYNDGSTSPVEFRKGVQLLQKSGPSNGELPPRPPRGERTNGAPPLRGGFSGRDGGSRRDHPPSPRMTRSDWGHPHAMAPSTSLQGRDREERGRRSDMGPPPVPMHATRRTSQESASGRRQLPPHLSPNMPLPRRLPSQDSSSRFGPAMPTSPTHSQRMGQAPPSPALSHTSLKSTSAFSAAMSPGSAAIALPGGVTADLNEVTKDLMQNAAQRAKARKVEEEREREAQKERARLKAAELEEKMKEKEEKERREKEEEDEKTKTKEREKEAVAFIESAVDGVKPPPPIQDRQSSIDATSTSLPKNLPRRPPSQRGQQRRVSAETGPGASSGPGARRASFGIGTRAAPVDAPSPASQVDSWRTKASPLPPLPPKQNQPRTSWVPAPVTSDQQQSMPTPAPPAATLVVAPSALDHVADIAEGSMTDLEVVDFSKMGEFVDGSSEEGKGEKEKETEVKDVESEKKSLEAESATKQDAELGNNKVRPTASDFFEDKSSTTGAPAKVVENVWRRKTSASVALQGDEKEKEKEKVVVVKEETTLRASSSAPVVSSTTATASPPHPSHQHPRMRLNAEASMSALDDVMSRIKGAIDGMQASGAASKENRPPEPEQQQQHHHHHHPHHTHQPPPRTSYQQPPSSSTIPTKPHRERWQPAPTPSHIQQQQKAAEEKLEALRESLSTSSDPLYTPPPTSPSSLTSTTPAAPPVHLPDISHKIEPIPRKQQAGFSRPPIPPRFDVLSFEPPVHGMNKREFTVRGLSVLDPSIILVVGMGTVLEGQEGFGKGGNADGAISWRKSGGPTPVSAKGEELEKQQTESVSDVSPKEESSSEHQTREDSSAVGTAGSSTARTATTRQQPKMMPAGSAVAFIRDSRIDVVEADPKPLVNFIVSSELDEPVVEMFSAVSVASNGSSLEAEKEKSSKMEGAVPLSSNVSTSSMDGMKAVPEPSSVQSTSSVGRFKVPENKSVEDSASTRSISSGPSSSHHSTTSTSTPWGRTSLSVPIKDPGNVRAPDPEHLKAVWSQPNKADLNPVNSLEGIADDLTSVPFSIQDVKSEDGETPPPALPPTTSRMSLHEVTKAFQKVPSSSSSSSANNRNPISPPSNSNNHTPTTTRSPYAYSPMPPNAMRLPHSAYEQHYSPMHSPSPTVIYPHQLTSSPVPSRMPVNGHAHPAPMYQAPVWIPQSSTPGNPGAIMRPMMSPYPTHMMPYGTPAYGHPMATMPTPQPQPPVGTNNAAVGAGRGRGVPMHMSPAMAHAHAHTHPGAAMYAGSPVMMHMQPVPHNAAYMGIPPQPGATATPGRGQQRTDVSQPHNHAQSTVNHQHSHQTFTPGYIRSTW
ncbi:hypothetical protein NP233_g9545 [Leucocoprinus birnbaumii]|uniref:Uncharacterized protein n=1 Tax=Leucocoprinus birnbaumii TaxID=56174 RepID=A0AAD5VK91_9AGAR|nr:hypothetical protein NP233_g9545 [Leucocoprinus birnbaumii]